MSTTYTSRYIIAGRRAGFINQITGPKSVVGTTGSCGCPQEINTKVVNSSNSTSTQNLTRVQRAVNTIRYSRGGKIQFGNSGNAYPGIVFLGVNEPKQPVNNNLPLAFQPQMKNIFY